MKVVGKKHYKQYTLKDILGAGAFGKVYYSPPYAIKEMNFAGMSPFLANALKNEISILNKINHPNVVKLVDFFYEGSSVYLVM
jgi:serine/threonine protein kinase